MAAGLSYKQAYNRVYRRLQTIRSKLARNGVPCRYDRLTLRPDGLPSVGPDKWSVWYVRLYASNGECAMLPCASVGGLIYKELGDFERAIKRIIEEFGKFPAA